MEMCYCKNETHDENTIDLTSDMCTDFCAGVITKLRDNYFYKLVIIAKYLRLSGNFGLDSNKRYLNFRAKNQQTSGVTFYPENKKEPLLLSYFSPKLILKLSVLVMKQSNLAEFFSCIPHF